MANKNNKIIWIYVPEDDYTEIAKMAKSTGLSLSAYGRQLLLNYRPRSVFDQEAVLAMMKANADLGRLGGLLKLAITEGKEKLHMNDFRELLEEIRKQQTYVGWCCRQVVDSYKKGRR